MAGSRPPIDEGRTVKQARWLRANELLAKNWTPSADMRRN